ncbi:hypothetical protein PIB30_115839, partial [Stylosanthes scabra]|nr:hypothetical protein [Stylosanthes scabra]MED6203478.1 hypothetical protein [Stylosanthes scabra]
EFPIGTPRPKEVRKNTPEDLTPKESIKRRATEVEELGLRKEILPGGGYRWCVL